MAVLGIFGMNFQVDAGYTIGLVNAPHGPMTFYLMCIGVFVVCFVFFVKQGWLDLRLSSIKSFLLTLFTRDMTKVSQVASSNNEKLKKIAEEEDAKRALLTHRKREALISNIEQVTRPSVVNEAYEVNASFADYKPV